MYKRDIYLDIDDNLNSYIKSVELDSNSRVWHFHLTVDYEPLDLTGKSVQFRAEKPDKTNVLNDCKIVDAKKGVVEVKLTRQVNAIPGRVKCLLKIIGAEGYVLKTKTFVVDVSKTLSDDDAVVSSDEFGALEVALGKVQDIDNRFAQTNAQLSHKASKIELAKESARIDVFTSLTEGSTTGDAELIDGRIATNGLTYKNIGSAIREQIEILDSQMNNYNTLLDYKKLDNLQSGFIGTDGVLNTSSSSHKVIKISAKNIKSFRIIKGSNELTSGLCYGVFKKTDGTVNRVIPYNIDSVEKELTDENRECDIYLNWFNFSENLYCSSIEITYISVDDRVKTAINDVVSTIPQEVIKYHHCVNRPFSFQGKEIVFFGDSITEGFVDGSSITQNGYPKLFAESVGATYKNYGVGGSCFSMVYNGIDTVVNKVKLNLKNTSPFTFIAAGVNDWQCGATKEQLRNALGELCEWLETNYTGTVIFITPINFAGRTPIVTPQMTIWEVRQIITEVALTYNYNVVQGWMFPFPTEVGTYSSTIFGDGLHLTENHGYKVYSQSLKNTLC